MWSAIVAYYLTLMCCSFSKHELCSQIKDMKINLKSGIDKLIFGMKQKILLFIGKPDRNYKDEETM
jgi:hypothetical protein